MEKVDQIIPLFPIPLYTNSIPQDVIEKCLPFLQKEPMKNMDPEWGSRSSNSYLFKKEEYKSLKEYILKHIINYSEQILDYDYKEYTFTQSWISIKYPNQSHNLHSHSNSLISGIVFYDDYNNLTSPIVFSRNDDWSNQYTNHPHQKNAIPSEYNSTECYIPVRNNSLLLFPSTLHHYVPKNTTKVPRKSLAFNIVPKNGFGREEDLNELKFNY